MVLNKENVEIKLPIIKKQKEFRRNLILNKIKEENTNLEKRLNQSSSVIKVNQYLKEFKNHLKYKNMIKRPEVVNLYIETQPNGGTTLKFKKSENPMQQKEFNTSINDYSSLKTENNVIKKHSRKLQSMDNALSLKAETETGKKSKTSIKSKNESKGKTTQSESKLNTNENENENKETRANEKEQEQENEKEKNAEEEKDNNALNEKKENNEFTTDI